MSDGPNPLLLAVCILLSMYYLSNIDGFTSRQRICNEIDGRCYPVVSKFENTMSASEMLAYLNDFCIKLMRYMRTKYLWNQQGSLHHANMTKRLLQNYVSENIIENAPNSTVNTSYVEDKGKVFAICLREKKSGKNLLHDKNILEFVVMHEMAHMASIAHGHEDMEFWTNFKILLQNAKEAKLHEPVNYANKSVNYCSLDVDYNPYFDDEVPV